MKQPFWVLIFLLVSVSIHWSCKQKKSVPESDFEQTVFYGLFPSLLNAMYDDWRLTPPPPPPPDLLEKKGYDVKSDYKKAYENWSKSAEYKQRELNWEKKRDSIKKDTTSIYLAISDSIYGFETKDNYELIIHFKNKSIVLDSQRVELHKGYKIELDSLKTTDKKFKFRYRSELPKGSKFWRTEYDFYIGGSIGFSRILYDTTKSFGVLNAGFGTDVLNGSGARIFIRKDERGKWIIDDIVGTWIS